jgi:hypothetical protein
MHASRHCASWMTSCTGAFKWTLGISRRFWRSNPCQSTPRRTSRASWDACSRAVAIWARLWDCSKKVDS